MQIGAQYPRFHYIQKQKQSLIYFLRLKGRDVKQFNDMMKNRFNLNATQFRPELRKKFFLLKQDSFLKAKNGLLSFVFVREPFQRLASAYWDKMDRNWTLTHQAQEMRDEILIK